MNFRCRRTRRELYSLASGRLPPADQARIEAHTRSCGECRTALEGMRMTVKLLDSWEPEAPSADFGLRLRRMILEHPLESVNVARSSKSFPFFFRGSKMWLPGAVAALLVVGVFVYRTALIPRQEQPIVRDVPLSIGATSAPTPLEVTVSDPADALNTLTGNLSSYGSRLVRRRPVASGLEVTLNVPQEQTSSLLGLLAGLGELKKLENSYKDGDGNVVVVLRQRVAFEGR